MFGFPPDATVAAVRKDAEPPRIPDYRASVMLGSLGFCVISLLVFGIWAFAGRALSRGIGEGGFYAVCAVAFVGLSGILFDRLVIGRHTLARFYGLFTAAFFSYALVWCAAWFLLKGKQPDSAVSFLTGARPAGLVGALLGLMAMAHLLCLGFRNWKPFPQIWLVLFVGNAVGYFLGDVCFAWFLSDAAAETLEVNRRTRVLIGQLGWGFFYGLGFGFGIGHALHRLQAPVRELLATEK